jgi:hypothetical protein
MQLRDSPIAGMGRMDGPDNGPANDPIYGLECPYYKWVGDDVASFGSAVVAPSQHATRADFANYGKHRDPALSGEAVDWAESFGLLTGGGAGQIAYPIAPYWQVWEMARMVVPVGALGTLEKVVTAIDSVEALDDDGSVLFAYGPQNGARSTLDGLLHPTPGIGMLKWAFRVTNINMGPNSDTPLRVLNGRGPQGRDVLDPWSHLSNGSDITWAAEMQRTIQSASLIRVFAMLMGPRDRFRVRIGARLTGYTQSGGPMGRALCNATGRAV